jgi:hypothetical protein
VSADTLEKNIMNGKKRVKIGKTSENPRLIRQKIPPFTGRMDARLKRMAHFQILQK